MSIRESDELVHPFGEDLLWRESLYFNWHDANGKVAGITTIGIRPNQHHYEGFAVLFLEQQVLFYHTQGPLEPDHGLYSVPGLACRMVAPLQRWQVEIKAHFAPLKRAETLSSPTTGVVGTLSFDAVAPAYLFPEQGVVALGIATGHYEQCGRIHGSISVGAETFEIKGLGLRDHSWGVRDLPKAANLVSLLAQFSSDFAVNAVWEEVGGQGISLGYVWGNGRNSPVTEVRVAVETDAQGLPNAAEAHVSAADLPPLRIRARVKAVMPIVLEQGGTKLRWCECFSQFDDDSDRLAPAYGILETTQLV